jgi:OOP family OmpA-OmpF porin
MRYSSRNLFLLSRAAIGTALMATAFAGCGGSSSSSSSAPPSSSSMAATCLTDKPAPLAVVIGERSNVPSVTLPSFVSTLLESAANAGQQISFVRIDGQPKIFTLPVFSSTAGNAAARNQDVVDYLNSYVPPILHGKLHAQAAQANVLTALDLAANATGPDGNIIVIDSGLQTVAPLDYTKGILMSPPSDLVTFLQQRQLLPDLSGRHVLLSGFGYTAAPQPTLNEAQRDNVVSQWKAIVKAGGGCVTSDPVPDTAQEIAGLPPVGIVTPPPTPA